MPNNITSKQLQHFRILFLSFDKNSYQKTYTATYDKLTPGKAFDELLMLYPYQLNETSLGKKYTVSVTIQSESFEAIKQNYTFCVKDISPKSIDEHIGFVSSDNTYRKIKENFLGSTFGSIKDDPEYIWSKYTSLDFKNYYDVVLADIIATILNIQKDEFVDVMPAVVKDYVTTYNKLLSNINKAIEEDYEKDFEISETKLDKLLKKSKYTIEGIHTDDDLYQHVVDWMGNVGNADKINKAFAAADKTKQVY